MAVPTQPLFLLIREYWPAGICVCRRQDGSVDRVRSALLLCDMITLSFCLGVSIRLLWSVYYSPWIIHPQKPVDTGYMRHAFELCWLLCQCICLFSSPKLSVKHEDPEKVVCLDLDQELDSESDVEVAGSGMCMKRIDLVVRRCLSRITLLDTATILSMAALGYSLSQEWFSSRIMYMRDPGVPGSGYPYSQGESEAIESLWNTASSLFDLEWFDGLFMDANFGALASPLFSFSDSVVLERPDCSLLSSSIHEHGLAHSSTFQAPIELSLVPDQVIDASHLEELTLMMDGQTLPQSFDFLSPLSLCNFAETDHGISEPLDTPLHSQAGEFGVAPSCLNLAADAYDWHSPQIDPSLQTGPISTASVPLTLNLDWLSSSMGASLDSAEPPADSSKAGEALTSTVAPPAPQGDIVSVCSLETDHVASSRQTVCQYCAKGFIRPSAYREHMNMHLGKKPHHCPSCDKSFSVRSNMLRHHRKKHPRDNNLHQTRKPAEEQDSTESASTSSFRERSYKDSGYSVYRLGNYGESNRHTGDRVGPTRRVRNYAREKLGGT